jgi:3-oxoacyl-[acyl-carrier protein] reductase
MSPRFASQVAIVTGGASGIGRAVAERLAREGARAVIWDVDQAGIDRAVAELGTSGFAAEGARVDITDEGQVQAALAALLGRTGRLDALVHAAGIVGPNNKRIVDVELAEFERVQRINLIGTFIVTKHALRAMQPRNYGRVLLFASIAGKEGNAGMCGYSSSKAGVIGLVKSAGKEFAETGITINAVAPAVIQTALLDQVAPAQIKYMTDKIPMKRTGTLDEIAALACWAVSPEASFTTAFTFDLSGGRATY